MLLLNICFRLKIITVHSILMFEAVFSCHSFVKWMIHLLNEIVGNIEKKSRYQHRNRKHGRMEQTKKKIKISDLKYKLRLMSQKKYKKHQTTILIKGKTHTIQTTRS